MPEFLTTHGTAARLEQIVARAAREVIVVSPCLQVTRTLLERLRDADGRGVPISLVYRDARLRKADEEALHALPRLVAYRSDDLHATCYLSERELLLTSMDLQEFSERSNREMGIVFAAGEAVYQEARDEVRSIVAAATRTKGGASPPSPRLHVHPRPDGSGSRGACIRCGCDVARRDRAPYCYECYAAWARSGNRSQTERFCHACGGPASTTIDAPRCDACAGARGSATGRGVAAGAV